MTNEEKAKEIANDMTLPWVKLEKPKDSIKQACEEMAEWKDEQFAKEKQALINKALHSFCFNCPSFDGNECCCCFGVCYAYEMFYKKLMEETK